MFLNFCSFLARGHFRSPFFKLIFCLLDFLLSLWVRETNKNFLIINRTLCPSRSLLPRLPAPRLPCANNKMFKRINPRWFARRPFRVKFRCVDIVFFSHSMDVPLKKGGRGNTTERQNVAEMSLEGAFANGFAVHKPNRNVHECCFDMIPARFD